jgi:DNA repair exonuclease SbcCD ATPase subunit
MRFLGLMSGGHECKFLEEAGSSFAIPHEEEYFENLSSVDLITACGELSLKNFVASRCLARRLEREEKKAKESSTVAATSLQNRVTELERRLAAEQEWSQQLLQAKEDEAKASHATLEALRLDMEKLASAREDMDVQLRDKDAELTEAKNEVSRLNSVLERYRTEHIRCAEILRSKSWSYWGSATLMRRPLCSPSAPLGHSMSG